MDIIQKVEKLRELAMIGNLTKIQLEIRVEHERHYKTTIVVEYLTEKELSESVKRFAHHIVGYGDELIAVKIGEITHIYNPTTVDGAESLDSRMSHALGLATKRDFYCIRGIWEDD